MPLDVLTELVGSTVIRIAPCGHETEYIIKNRKWAEVLFDLQQNHGYKIRRV